MNDAASSSATVSSDPLTVSRLRWRCRRGMRELDVLLERYLQERYPCAPAAEQQAFAALLEVPDPQLFAYVVQREVPEIPEWVHVIARLRNDQRESRADDQRESHADDQRESHADNQRESHADNQRESHADDQRESHRDDQRKSFTDTDSAAASADSTDDGRRARAPR